MTQPEDTEYGRCDATAKSTGDQCKRAATGEHGKCNVHGGADGSGAPDGNTNSTSDGAPDGNNNAVGNSGGSPAPGNNNAAGNSGGSPPLGNGNAEKHALHANRGLFYERLDETKQAVVDELEAALIDRYQEYHGRDPDKADVRDMFEIAIGYVQRDYAREYMVEQAADSGNPMLEHVEMYQDGTEIEFDKPNDILDKIGDNRREDRLGRRDKGLEKDPETQQADALADGVDLTLSVEEKDELEQAFDVEPDTESNP